MGLLFNVLLLCWTWIRLISKSTMSVARSLLFLTCLKSEATLNFCRGNSQSSTKSAVSLEHHGTLSPSTRSFVKDFVKSNLGSITTQIIKNGRSSNDICTVEQGVQKAKYTKKKFSKRSSQTTKKSPSDYHEISEISSGSDPTQNMRKASRPNYFFAVQITDSKVLENAKRIQDSILENSHNDLKHMKVDIGKSHITLMAMHLADSLAVNSAKDCLDQSVSAIGRETNSEPITLEFDGLDEFSGGSVLFVTVKPSAALQSLISLSDIIREDMKQRGIVGAGKDFKPHMTLMKYRWKKQTKNSVKKVEKAAYKEFKKEYLGSHTISSIQLCKMEGVREDGYYIVEHEVFFNS